MIKWLLLSALSINLVSFFWFSSQGKFLSGRENSAVLWQNELAGEIVLLSELEVVSPARQGLAIEGGAIEAGLVEPTLQDGVGVVAKPPTILPLSASVGAKVGDTGFAGLEAKQQVIKSGDLEEDVSVKDLLREQVSELESLSDLKSESELRCVIVGRFDKEKDVRGLLAKLQDAVGVTAKLNEVVEGLVRYLVYMRPYDTRAMAKERQAELREAGIRSSLYYKGELKNGLSLGYYVSRENAERRYKDLVAEGYKVEFKVTETKITRYWLELQGGDDAKLSQQFWRDVAQAFPGASREEVACSFVE